MESTLREAAHDAMLAKGKRQPETGCLLWAGASAGGNDGKGRWGKAHVQGQTYYVHRLAYELEHGEIPQGYVIKQLCGNRLCFETTHLMAITLSDKRNLSEFVYPDHCAQGHAFAGDNLTYDTNGSRRCLTCRREQTARSNRKIRAAKKENV